MHLSVKFNSIPGKQEDIDGVMSVRWFEGMCEMLEIVFS